MKLVAYKSIAKYLYLIGTFLCVVTCVIDTLQFDKYFQETKKILQEKNNKKAFYNYFNVLQLLYIIITI